MISVDQLNTILTQECSKLWAFFNTWGLKPTFEKAYNERFYEEIIQATAPIPQNHKFWAHWKENKDQLKLEKKLIYKVNEQWYLRAIIVPSEFKHPLDDYNETSKLNTHLNLSPEVEKLLKPHQLDAARFHYKVLNEKNVVVDISDPGTGKTYVTCAVLREKNVTPVCIVPKVITSGWLKAFKHFAIQRYYLTTWDLMKRGKFLKIVRSKRTKKMTYKHEKLPFVRVIPNPNTDKYAPKNLYVFTFTDEMCLVWDEAHRLKNMGTQVFQMFVQLMNNKPRYMFLLSATMAESPAKAIALMMALGLIKNERHIKYVMESFHCYKKGSAYDFQGTRDDVLRLHELISHHGMRMKMAMIDGLLPQTVIPEVYDIEDAESIDKLYELYQKLPKLMKLPKDERDNELIMYRKKIKESALVSSKIKEITEYAEYIYEQLSVAQSMDWALAIRTRLLQIIELNKLPILLELVKDALDQGYSVPIFLNYTMNIKILASLLKTDCVFTGKNKELGFRPREECLAEFQRGDSRIIIGTFTAMRESVDLHDTYGNFPRMVFMPFNDSAQFFIQAIGRTHRVGKKSADIVYVIHIADTIEEKVKENLEQKLFNLSLLNDGDLDPTGAYMQLYRNKEVEI
jgi:superfamily II DNA or RNA helicase